MKKAMFILVLGFTFGLCSGQTMRRLGMIDTVELISSYNHTYPRIRVVGDVLFVGSNDGLYKHDLLDPESGFEHCGFAGLPVVDAVRKGDSLLAITADPTARLCLSPDNGKTIENIPPAGFLKSGMLRLAQNPLDPDQIFLATSYTLYKTSDFGKTWVAPWNLGFWYSPDAYIQYHPLDTSLFFVGGTEGWDGHNVLYLNGEEIKFGSYGYIYDVAFHPTDPDIILFDIINGTGALGKSTDRGKTWKPWGKIASAPAFRIDFDYLHPDTMYALLYAYDERETIYQGVYVERSGDAGFSWHRCFRDVHIEIGEVWYILDVLFYKNSYLIYTTNHGIIAVDLEKSNEDVEVARTEKELLLTISPNPTKETLRFETVESVRRIEMTDVAGRRVLNMPVADGSREIHVGHLPVGMYVACFHTDQGFIRKKVAIAR